MEIDRLSVDISTPQAPRTAATSAYPSRQSSYGRDSPKAGQKRPLDKDVSRNDSPALQITNGSLKKLKIDSSTPQFAPDASIILVGIPRSGKRSLGIFAAASLGRRLVHSGQYFERVTGLSRPEYEAVHQDKKKLLEKDIEVLRRMLNENPSGCVIDCGSTSLYSSIAHYLRPYCQTNPVIHVQRDLTAIRKLFDIGDDRAKQLAKQHQSCSNFDYFNIEEPIHLDHSFKLRDAQTDFVNFLQHVSDPRHTNGSEILSAFSANAVVESKLFSHALCLPVSVFKSCSDDLMFLQGGGDVALIFIDEWELSNTDIEKATTRITNRIAAQARRWLQMPLMVAVSSNLSTKSHLEALQFALRLAPDLLLVDLAMDKNVLRGFAARKGLTRLFGSILHSRSVTALEETSAKLETATSLGIDLVRVTLPAISHIDEENFEYLTQTLKQKFPSIHFSTYLTGDKGRKTQIFNRMLTDVSHEYIKTELQIAHVQSQLTSRQALEGLFKTFVLDRLFFAVFGANVSSSLSPTMHNAAYTKVGLPHTYSPINVNTWDDIKNHASQPDFGGASIAQPWKVKIVAQLSFMSDHARAVGAINTLIPLRGKIGETISAHMTTRSSNNNLTESVGNQAVYRNRAGDVVGFYGDNSDWMSIQVCLKRNITPVNAINPNTTALVVGAGGMARAACYALLQSGCRKIFIYNRTISNANLMADHFMTWSKSQDFTPLAEMKVIESTEEPWPAGYHQPTVIVSCVTHERIPGEESVADFTVPKQWLQSSTGGAAIEQAYYVNTPFIKQIKQLQISTGRTWVVVDGLEVLHEQAVAQFELMTGRKAPRTLMWNTLQDAVTERDKR